MSERMEKLHAEMNRLAEELGTLQAEIESEPNEERKTVLLEQFETKLTVLKKLHEEGETLLGRR